MGGGSSSSSSDRTYNTTNVSQQAQAANVYGKGNRVFVQRADAVTLDNIAKTLESGVHDVTSAGEQQVSDTLDTARAINADSLDVVGNVNADSLALASQVVQGAQKGNQEAMDFVSNYTERAQTGNAGEATRTVMWVALVAGVTLVGIAYTSRGGMKA